MLVVKANLDENISDHISKLHYQWVDGAKGISIFLVVLWHSKIDSEANEIINKLNESLIFLRMPLFFFIAGFFLKKSLNDNWIDFLKFKISNLIWIFLVWAIIADLVLFSVPELIKYGSISIKNPLQYFYNPPATLWFIYALAISLSLIKLLKVVPNKVVILFLIIGYCFSTYNGEWRNVDFEERIIRLVPFMFLGLISFRLINEQIEKYYKFAASFSLPLPLILYGVMFTDLKYNPIITLCVSFISLLSIIGLSYLLTKTKLKNWIVLLGKNSLYIYVMHKLVIFCSLFLLSNAHLDSQMTFVLVFLLALLIPLIIKNYFVKGFIRYLYNQPLFKKKHKS